MSVLKTNENRLTSWLGWLLAGAGLALIWIASPLEIPHIPLNSLSGQQAAWHLSRSSGAVAYLMLSASTIWGLLLSSKLTQKSLPPLISLAMHNYLAWAAIGFSLFHGLILLFDNFYSYNLANLIIPFTGPYEPIWVGLGIVGFYLMLLTSASFYWRKWIGQKVWRGIHTLTFGAFVLTTFHGWHAGSDTNQLLPMYATSGLLVIFLTLYRLLNAIGR